jgi:hypothetical protein
MKGAWWSGQWDEPDILVAARGCCGRKLELVGVAQVVEIDLDGATGEDVHDAAVGQPHRDIVVIAPLIGVRRACFGLSGFEGTDLVTVVEQHRQAGTGIPRDVQLRQVMEGAIGCLVFGSWPSAACVSRGLRVSDLVLFLTVYRSAGQRCDLGCSSLCPGGLIPMPVT